MTEFLIFLGMCAGFSALLWRLLRSPRKPQLADVSERTEQWLADRDARVTKRIVALTEELDGMTRHAKEYLASNPAAAQSPSTGFGGKVETADIYAKVQAETPFGEDITNPDARTIPAIFHGKWAGDGYMPETIAADRMNFTTFSGEREGVFQSREEEVVAVRYIDGPKEIAIVTKKPDGNYSFHYRGIDEEGRLINLESGDWKLDRC